MLDMLFPLSEQMLALQQRPYVRYFLKKQEINHRLTIIRGQRGVGKSTVLAQHLLHITPEPQKRLYVPLDHFLVKNYSLYEIAEAFALQGGQYLGLDEIHKYMGWSQELKSIYDTFPQLQVVASGSSALAIQQGSHDLSRRAVVYTLHGMSFREYIALVYHIEIEPVSLSSILEEHAHIARTIIKKLQDASHHVLPLFAEYLKYGYYPYAVEFTDKNVFYMTLEQSLHTVIESDLPAIHPTLSGASVDKMKRLFSFLSTHVPFEVDLKSLKTILDIADERTLKQYMKIMEEAGIIAALHKNDKKLDGLKKADKIYPNNTCQLYALGSDKLVDKGTLREIFFLSMLRAEHTVQLPLIGDFLIDKTYTLEVGGKNKKPERLKNITPRFLALDDIEQGYEQKIPLWLFGFIY